MKVQLGKQTGIALALLAALLATLLAMGVFSVAQATEHEPSASRSFSGSAVSGSDADGYTVAVGGEVVVTIAIEGDHDEATIVEAWPEGFNLDASSLPNFPSLGATYVPGNNGRSFIVRKASGELPDFSYTVTAPQQAGGPHSFQGVFQGKDGTMAFSGDIADATMITVVAAATDGNGNGNGTDSGDAGAESARLTTDKASSATRLTITGSGSQLGEVGPGDEIVINLDKFGLPSSIAEADVTIDDGDNTANPRSVSVSGSNITLQLGKFDGDQPNSHDSNIIDSSDTEITITIRDRAGITTPVKAGKYTVKVDAKDRSDDGDTYDLDGDNMMVSIIRSISVKPTSATRGTEITITGKGFSDGSAGVTAGNVSIGAADIVDGSFTLTVNNNLKVNNNSAFVKGPDGTDINASDGAGDEAETAANHKIKATFTVSPESPNPGQDVTITLADTDATGSSTVSVSFGGGRPWTRPIRTTTMTPPGRSPCHQTSGGEPSR